MNCYELGLGDIAWLTIMSFQEYMPYVDDIDFEYIEITNIQ